MRSHNGRMDGGLVAILVGLIAAAAALIGSRLTSQATDRTLKHAAELERARWTRDDMRRHEEVRRDAYPAFLATVDGAVHAVHAVLSGAAPPQVLPGARWRYEQRASLAVIEFVGTPVTIDRAVRLDRAVNRLVVGATRLVSASGIEVGGGDVDTFEPNEGEEPDENIADAERGVDGGGADDEAVAEEPSEDELLAAAQRFRRVEPGDPSDPMSFLNALPYPLGDDPAPERMYGGQPLFQVSMARAELRVRRHEFVNAAREDLGMTVLDFPDESIGSSRRVITTTPTITVRTARKAPKRVTDGPTTRSLPFGHRRRPSAPL